MGLAESVTGTPVTHELADAGTVIDATGLQNTLKAQAEEYTA